MTSKTNSEKETSSEYKTYRRVICAKVNKENIKQFLQIFKDDGWHKVKILGKRGAKYSFIKGLPNKTRYHMRLYEIDEYFYLLIHHEPTVKGDISFHIIGLFDRFKSKKENILSAEKLELANYQAGNDYFRKELMKKFPILSEICEFKIDEDELKYFAMKFGYISLKLPLEILIEDLSEIILKDDIDIEELNQVLVKLFSTLDFKPLPIDSSEFIIIESPSLKNFRCLIKKVKISELDLLELGNIIKQYKITSTVLIPQKQDIISATLSQKLERLNISIIPPLIFLKIFHIYKNFPISPEQFQKLFKGGLITSQYVDDTLQTAGFSDFLNKATKLFSYLKNQIGWTSYDTLEYEFVKQDTFTKDELKSLLQFLAYPLINLLLVKLEKRRLRKDKAFYRVIKNFDELQFRLKNIKKFLSKIT
ncbi:MAG: hypothetical protein ACTSYB_17650 [Candidatus Helarchaeota archaeon]